MSETIFTATNGLQVKIWQDQPFKGRSRMETRDEVGENMLDGHDFMGNEEIEALREFFQLDRDEELGRWRWPEHPEFVVYPKEPSVTEPEPGVRVVNEMSGRSKDIIAAVVGYCPSVTSMNGEAAKAYFAAHPEPKPWHDAKEGEVWIVTPSHSDGLSVEYPTIFQAERFRDHGGSWDAEDLIDARRIWPTED